MAHTIAEFKKARARSHRCAFKESLPQGSCILANRRDATALVDLHAPPIKMAVERW